MIECPWSEIKRLADSKGLPLQWIEVAGNYHIILADGPFLLSTSLPVGVGDADTSVFEATYKAAGNKRTESNAPSFTSKLVGTKKLFARNTGYQFALSAGSNIFTITASLPWAKVTGVEVFGAETLDYADFKVKDTAAGTYSGIPNYILNQFGFAVNIAKDYYRREATFDADLYQGMVLEFTYNSVSAKTIGINIIMAEVK